MRSLTKTLCALLTTVASISVLSTNAIAGEGGAAGSAAFSTDGAGNVTGVAVSAAVGKQDAFAGAFNDAFMEENTAFAQGSAGTITVTGLGSLTVGSITSAADPALATNQANSFTSQTTVQIGTSDGAPVVQVGNP